jgi:hypothetical protein
MTNKEVRAFFGYNLTPSLPWRQSAFVFLCARANFDFYGCVYKNMNISGILRDTVSIFGMLFPNIPRPQITAVRWETKNKLIFFIYLSSFIAHYPHVSSKSFTFTHITGYATGVTLESRLHKSGADQSFSVSFSRASFFSHFFLHSYFTVFCPLSFISRSKSSL